MSILSLKLTQYFDQNARRRAQWYFRGNSFTTDRLARDLVTGSCFGTSEYRFHLEWERPKRKKLHLGCSCPSFEQSGPCKHLWAVILHLDKTDFGQDLPQSLELTVIPPDQKDFSDSSIFEDISLPGQKQGLQNLVSFVTKQNQLSAPDSLSSSTKEPTREAWFGLDLDDFDPSDEIVISFFQKEKTEPGNWGRLKKLRLDTYWQHGFSNTDQLLVESMLKLVPVTAENKSYWSEPKVTGSKVPQGIAANVLKKLSRSNRLLKLSKNGGASKTLVKYSQSKVRLDFLVKPVDAKQPDTWNLTPQAKVEEPKSKRNLLENSNHGFLTTDLFFSNECIFEVQNSEIQSVFQTVVNSPVCIRNSEKQEFLSHFLQAVPVNFVQFPEDWKVEISQCIPQPILALSLYFCITP